MELILYVLLYFILLFLIVFILLLSEIKKMEKENLGMDHLLEKSEASRINAEKLKNKVLLMINDLPEGILIIDKDGKVSVVNSRAEKFLGLNKKQILNKTIFDLGHLSDVKKIVSPTLVNFKGVHREEINLRKNFILELTIEPLVLEKNNTAKLIILRDITKMKYAEVAKDQFITVAAHQLKSPLTAVGLSLKMILDQDFGKISKEQRNILDKTYKKNEFLMYLVEDLLKDARADGVAQPETKSMVDLGEVADSIIDFYRDEIKRKNIGFKLNKTDKKLPKILVDKEKIKMVVQNLFDNAVKYTPKKGKIEVSIISKKEGIEFEIKDSGIGVPENQKERIFKRFSRATNAIGSKAPGTGLGLAIAKDVIEKYRGKIWFESKENKGSTFYFTLPTAKQ